ncbi:4a-hydroxytetrahydrobiopterin dehydratase [Natrinema sp. J7-2]|uniref:4a-hydroxytetrahydrobiopterin dehydratase n=1 Tax=Natrinema sp. (strain J7-2) TaxID=406552 RepID=UPI00026D48A2|nr:4a-hydroxytetrahydrobiopterin dehydratase [Natrinema sp. J7-2]AFO57792.1 pterin-4a-carbinolamine dehydratase [Natrinema sp. J7-2]
MIETTVARVICVTPVTTVSARGTGFRFIARIETVGVEVALEFTAEVGELAEAEWHHPAIELEWGEVTIELWPHKIDGLHKTDFVMAARMDRIYDDYEPDEDA